MADRVLRISALLRGDDVQSGNAGLTDLAADLRGFATMLQAITESPGLERQWLATEPSGPREQLQLLGGWLGSLVSAQATADWLTVADLLEYDLDPALRRWDRQLHAFAA